jgi:hypothetical protein
LLTIAASRATGEYRRTKRPPSRRPEKKSPSGEAGIYPCRGLVSPHSLAGKIIVSIHVGIDGVAFANVFASQRAFRSFLAEVIRVAYRSAAHTVEFFDGQFVHFFAFANFFAHAIHLLVCGVGTIPAP